MTISEIIAACLLWGFAGFLWGRTIGRRKYEALRMEMANKETLWNMERVIWSRHGEK